MTTLLCAAVPAGRRARRWLGLAGVASLVGSGLLAAAPAASAASSLLVRYPYLTDVTTTSVQVTFDTTTKVTSASGAVRWGTPSGSTGCTLTGTSASSTANSVNAPITVAGVTEYQTSIRISGLAAGTSYCYRVYTGGTAPTDLLGSDVAPRFATLPTSGAVTFDVLGDWGDDSIAAGQNQRNIDALIAASGAQFAVSTGDIAYPSGSQTNYGNLVATGTAVSEVFGPGYWKAPGASVPLFASAGNHGRSTTFLQNWKQAATVAASGGKYVMESYSGLDGTTAASYPSVWYAFDAGGARFYVLDADWSDSNTGTAPGGAYQVDRDYHWQPTSPEYQWLKADLESHANSLKLAFFHYPLRSDNATESSDTYLQGDPNNPSSTASLEGLLANNGVDLAFNGHAHLYQRNLAPPGAVTSYVTGGGGAKVEPVSRSRCATTDAYAVGWSYSSASGSACGAAPTPGSDARVFHFLKVAVSGSTVTVTPTDSTGATFDAVTYDFAQNSVPPAAPTGLLATAVGSTVKLSWTASPSSDSSAQDVYRNGRWLATVGPAVSSYLDAAPLAGASYTVRAHDLVGNQSGDSAPAGVGSGTDSTPPSAPGNLTAAAAGPTSVQLSWTASTDNVGVTGYEIYRNSAGTPLATVAGTVTSYLDNTVAPATTYSYTVRARDAAGNSTASNAASVTTPAGTGTTIFASDDVTVDQAVPDAQPSATASRVVTDGSPVNNALIQFKPALPAGCATVTRVTLSLTVGTNTDDNSVRGGDFFLTDNAAWSQTAISWNIAPKPVGTAVFSQGAVALGQTVTVDLTGRVDVTAPFTVRISTTSGDAARYYSREGSATLGPRLSVTC
ncbi:fibronectin type III domain-containing protein [Jatrophihabitans sp.]|uniref:fibronectin type III domain-containing protein n=1 Tax=Jatrophihabitans sp. TaxID=1932789 RepID=UPI002C9D2755|nr:DNRLRE domain-containing protein [Jatrophihabitans sp.]